MYLGLLSADRPVDEHGWRRLAPATSTVEIEIGPGDARFLVESARANPSTLYVGIEAKLGAATRAAKRPDLPANAIVLHGDARWILRHLVADASVDVFHLYFPDPWWKKRHHKRRLLESGFSAVMAHALKAGGSILLISDVAPAFERGCRVLAEVGLQPEQWGRDPASPAQSSYERKYRRQGRRLYEARFRKPGRDVRA